MHPAAVVLLVLILQVGAVVECADGIAVIQQRNAAEGENHAVQQHDGIDAGLYCCLIVVRQRGFQPGQRGERAGDSGVAGFFVDAESETV